MDGVLVDLTGGISLYYDKPNPLDDLDIPVGRDIMMEDFGLVERDIVDTDVDFWVDLPLMHDCMEIVELVERKYGKDNVVIASKSITPCCSAGKFHWLARHLPDYVADERHMIGARKWLMANSKTVLIDDTESNIELFHKKGGLGLIMPRQWNCRHRFAHKAMETLRSTLP